MLRDRGFVRQAALDVRHLVASVEAAFELVERRPGR
jgi:hypothetical protein